MNIIVLVKQVPDTEAVLSVKEGKSINEENIKWIISPYDEYAIEEALKLKEKLSGSTVKVISLGPNRVESTLRSALAMGADSAVHIETESFFDKKNISLLIGEAIKKSGEFGVIFAGRQSIDDDSYQTHILVAEMLGIPVATNITSFIFEDNKVIVEREIDEGAVEKIEMPVPCLVAATKGLNEPRYASLMGIMKAKKIPIEKFTPEDLTTLPDNMVSVEKLFSLPEKPQGRVLEGEHEDMVKELVKLLKEEAKVL